MNDKATAKFVTFGFITVLVTILITLFTFSYQRATEAHSIAIQNKERIAVVEARFDELVKKIDEIHQDVKKLLQK